MGKRFATFAWFVLAYNIAVILFGAFVRASFSGDGCGSHWPGCGGEIIPTLWTAKKAIEFTHRISTAIDGILVLWLVIWAFLRYKARSAISWSAAVAMVFIVVESLIGRGLVTFGWVAHDTSAERAVVQSVHLANTFLLLASLAACWIWARGTRLPSFRGQSGVVWALGIGCAGMVLLGISGAVTALGDALFPVSSSSQAVIDSLDPTKHFLVRLRVLHPLLAVSVGLYLVLIAGVIGTLRPSETVKKWASWMAGVFMFQLALGLSNVLLKAPIAMQLVHLLVADVQWILLVGLSLNALAQGVPRAETAKQEQPVAVLSGWPLVKQYLLMTKPRVISLLLFTTLAAMFMAAGGWPGIGLFVAVALGGYMAAGAANTINMVLESDLDERMARTAKRPTVTHNISSNNALRFGFALALSSFALLWWSANLLTAMLALAGLVFYVVVYTLMLKRRTWQNIVIGGAAGSFPPLVGWAAVTGSLSPLAWTLFGIIFVWTPVHFWALALMIKDDYARAGVPMLPVVRGERATVIQIALYALLTVVVTVLPLIQKEAGTIYLWAAVLLNVLLLVRCYQLLQHTDRPHAVVLYKYSMLYLALLFLVLAVDRAGNRASPPVGALPAQQVLGYGHERESFGKAIAPKAAGKTVTQAMDASYSGVVIARRALLWEDGIGSDL
jgi:protoheme IX farnesyltransferase